MKKQKKDNKESIYRIDYDKTVNLKEKKKKKAKILPIFMIQEG